MSNLASLALIIAKICVFRQTDIDSSSDGDQKYIHKIHIKWSRGIVNAAAKNHKKSRSHHIKRDYKGKEIS